MAKTMVANIVEKAITAARGDDAVFDEWADAHARGDGQARHVAHLVKLRLRLWDFLRGVRAAAGEQSPAFKRARLRERVITAVSASVANDRIELDGALKELRQLLGWAASDAETAEGPPDEGSDGLRHDTTVAE